MIGVAVVWHPRNSASYRDGLPHQQVVVQQTEERFHGGGAGPAHRAEHAVLVQCAANVVDRTGRIQPAVTWNVRYVHMADTLDRIDAHHGPDAKAVAWAHNTHLGDARGAEMTAVQMSKTGQLSRERHGRDQVVLVGLGWDLTGVPPVCW